MNIDESKSLLGWVSLNKLYIDTHNECDYHNIHTAIETLLTAYEKEKEKSKNLEIELEIKKYCKVNELASDLIYYKNLAREYQGNCISKDKIKAKIEEIKKSKENIYFEEHLESILQSLLEKE